MRYDLEDAFLPFATPESQGVSSEALTTFIRDLEADLSHMHGIVVMRHGKIIAETYTEPYGPKDKHRFYSTSKSFTSLAVGCLIAEGKLSFSDRVAAFFPEKCPENIDPLVADMTVRDLLLMASPFNSGSDAEWYDKDWTSIYLARKADKVPGTAWAYDSDGTTILCAVIERLTGQTFIRYLYDKVLSKIGFTEDVWCVRNPEGVAWGASGVMATARDMARTAQLVMQGGAWNGEQLLPADYVKEATSPLIEVPMNSGEDPDNVRLAHGYGYQIWNVMAGGFGFWGMGDQYGLCFPKEDVVLATIGDNQISGDLKGFRMIRNFVSLVLENCSDVPLPENPAALAELRRAEEEFRLPVPLGEADSPWIARASGVRYEMKTDNRMQLRALRLDFATDEGVLTMETDRGERVIRFGLGKYLEGEFPEPGYFGEQIGVSAGRLYRCFTAGVFETPNTLLIRCDCTDIALGSGEYRFTFDGDRINVYMRSQAEWFLGEYKGQSWGVAVE